MAPPQPPAELGVRPASQAPAASGMGTFVRYLLTGGALFLLDLAVFLAFVEGLGWEPMAAQPISRAVGAAAGFFGHRYVTFFRNRHNPQHAIAVQGSSYIAVSVGMLFFTPLVLQLFLMLLGGSLVAAKLATEVVAVIVVYFSLKLVFAAKGNPP